MGPEMDRQWQEQPPRDPDLGFRWAMYALLVAATTVQFGPALRDLLP